MRAVAVNVGANTTLPGFRGPVRPDGSFAYVPIPEREPVADDAAVPTYADLAVPVPDDLLDRRVHLDPEFAGYPECEHDTYGDEHGVKARPLSELRRGDHAYFYATLEPTAEAPWLAPEWAACVIGRLVLDRDPVTGEEYPDLSEDERAVFANNAHVKRAEFDARVLLHGDPDRSGLLDHAVPLSAREAGADPNRLVAVSADSGRGPWWRRPLRYEAAAAEELARVVAETDLGACFGDG